MSTGYSLIDRLTELFIILYTQANDGRSKRVVLTPITTHHSASLFGHHPVVQLAPHIPSELVLQPRVGQHVRAQLPQPAYLPHLGRVVGVEQGVQVLHCRLYVVLCPLRLPVTQPGLHFLDEDWAELALDLELDLVALRLSVEVNEQRLQIDLQGLLVCHEQVRQLLEPLVLPDVVDLTQGKLADLPLSCLQTPLQSYVCDLRLVLEKTGNLGYLLGLDRHFMFPVDGKSKGPFVKHVVYLRLKRLLPRLAPPRPLRVAVPAPKFLGRFVLDEDIESQFVLVDHLKQSVVGNIAEIFVNTGSVAGPLVVVAHFDHKLPHVVELPVSVLVEARPDAVDVPAQWIQVDHTLPRQGQQPSHVVARGNIVAVLDLLPVGGRELPHELGVGLVEVHELGVFELDLYVFDCLAVGEHVLEGADGSVVELLLEGTDPEQIHQLFDHLKYSCKWHRGRCKLIDYFQMEKRKSIPAFLRNTYELLQRPQLSPVVAWADSGNGFVIKNLEKFSNQVLPQYFKHSKYTSFVRQLNMYGFHKQRHPNNYHHFAHQSFKQGALFSQNSPSLLNYIRRKPEKKKKGSEQEVPNPNVREQGESDGRSVSLDLSQERVQEAGAQVLVKLEHEQPSDLQEKDSIEQAREQSWDSKMQEQVHETAIQNESLRSLHLIIREEALKAKQLNIRRMTGQASNDHHQEERNNINRLVKLLTQETLNLYRSFPFLAEGERANE